MLWSGLYHFPVSRQPILDQSGGLFHGLVAIHRGSVIIHSMMKNRFKKGYYAACREAFKEYGFPLRLVMRGVVVNGRFYLTNKVK